MSGLVFDPSVLPPGRMTLPSIVGASIEGGRSLTGIANDADISGGGLVQASYQNIQLGNTDASRLRNYSRLTALNGGVRSILVTFNTDFLIPGFVAGGPVPFPVAGAPAGSEPVSTTTSAARASSMYASLNRCSSSSSIGPARLLPQPALRTRLLHMAGG